MANAPTYYKGKSGRVYEHVPIYRDEGYTSQDSNISSEETEIERTDRRWMHLHVIRTGVFLTVLRRVCQPAEAGLREWTDHIGTASIVREVGYKGL